MQRRRPSAPSARPSASSVPERRGPRRSTPGGRRQPDKGAIWRPGPSARTVTSEAGCDLAHFIAQVAQGGLSVRAVRRALDQGACRVNGQVESFGSRKLRRDDVVEFFVPAQHARDHDINPERIVHQDEMLVAYDKPAGLPVTIDDRGRKWNLADALKKHLGGLVIPVHRLDADTSGLVIFARAQKVARTLEEAFRDHLVRKTYLALVRGHPRETGERRSYLVREATDQPGIERWKSGRGADAREAVTTWTVEERVGRYASLVRVEPKTGRYHQIRIHFSELGHPIYGDRLYGDRADPIHVTRHLLHAWKITLPHPDGERELSLMTPYPADITAAISELRRRVQGS